MGNHRKSSGWAGAAGRRANPAHRRVRPVSIECLETRDLLALAVNIVNPTEGLAFGGKVATFETGDVAGGITDFSATINWGDGNTSVGSIVADGPNGFDIVGSNTYVEENLGGNPYTITVTVKGTNNTSATGTGAANVGDAPLTASGTNIAPPKGIGFTGLVASFHDTNPAPTLSDFSALINWGDGTSPDAGSITPDGQGGFNVIGSHTYNQSGSFTTSITVKDVGAQSVIALGSAKIPVPSVTPFVPIGQFLVTTAGVAIDPTKVVVGAFKDNVNSLPLQPSNYNLSINWGDSHTSAGTPVIPSPSSNLVDIIGTNTYATPGTYNVTITVQDLTGDSTTIPSTVVVTGPVLTPIGTTITPVVGQPLPATTRVASFLDTNPADTPANLQATITWGDGHVTAGNVVAGAIPNEFDVEGSNTYLSAGTNQISVLLVNTSGQTATASSTAIVAQPTITPIGTTFAVLPGVPFSGTVATFTDTNPAAKTSLPTASISWGDSHATQGTVTGPDANGLYTVSGTYTYFTSSTSGPFTVTVTITDVSGQTATAKSTAVVGGPVLTPIGRTITPAVGLPLPTNTTVASFTDLNTSDTANTVHATITWGDGHVTAGTIANFVTATSSTAGHFDVQGTNTYASSGTDTISVVVVNDSGQMATATSTANVAAPTITPIGTTFTVTPGVPFSGTVATFTDTNPAARTTLPTASIAWGDGQTTQGTVGGPDANGLFTVSGTHTYFASGTSGSDAVTVTITDVSGQTAMAKSTAVLTGPVLFPIGTTITPAVDQPLPATTTVASFTDLNTSDTMDSIRTTITWGDGHVTTGMIANFVPANPATATNPAVAGHFDVQGTNTYAAAGTDTITVVVVNNSGQSATATSTAIVAAPTITPIGTTFSATPGVPFSGTVATFTDTNLAATASLLSALIAWGDGQTTQGTVGGPDASGLSYTIMGTHTYFASSAPGSFSVTVTITDVSGQTATAKSTALVSGPVLTAIGTTITAAIGQPLPTTTVASFTDLNTSDTCSTVHATITWGDGHVTTGTIANFVAATPAIAGHFDVQGTNTYAAAGTDTITVVVVNNSGQSATATSRAIVAAPTITPIGTTFTVTPGVPFSGTVATFTDTNLAARSSPPTAVVDWGDGHTSQFVSKYDSSSSLFTVTATYTYLTTPPNGSFPVTVTITDVSGQSATAKSTALVVNTTTPNPYAFAGGLSLQGNNGPGASTGFTRVNRPTFSGTTEPFAIVQLFAVRSGVDATEPLGQTIASGVGQWSLLTGPLADGVYQVTAVVTPPGESPSGAMPLTVNNGKVTIDTAPPRVTSASSIADGRSIVVLFKDGPSGLNTSSLKNPASYTLVGAGQHNYHPVKVTILTAGNSRTDSQGVVLTTTRNPKLHRTFRSLRINAAAITDNAGNTLQGDQGGAGQAASGSPVGNIVITLNSNHGPRISR